MNPDKTKQSRRSFLATTGGLAVGLGVARLPGVASAQSMLPPLPWPYPKTGLDPAVVRRAGYCLYFKEGGCGHGSAQALIDALASALAAENPSMNPWALLPRGLYTYGAGGVVGWATICGTLNGSLAVMDILGVHGKLGNALIEYFTTAALPTNGLVGYVPPAGIPVPRATLPTSVSNSPLCHISVSSWAASAGVPLSDPSTKDRCGKLVGDIVARAAELMNDYFLQGITPAAWTPSSSYATCYSCHTQPGMIPSQQGKMDCDGCHNVAPGHGNWQRRRVGSGAASKR